VLTTVSVLFNEPKLLKSKNVAQEHLASEVSVLFNEPKLLKYGIPNSSDVARLDVSVLFNEPKLLKSRARMAIHHLHALRFSALQRAEIAEIFANRNSLVRWRRVSVLFNEPKLLKSLLMRQISTSLTKFQCSSTSRNC